MGVPQCIIVALCIFLPFIRADATSGCGKSVPAGVTPGKTSKMTLTQPDGTPRSYLLHLPAAYTANATHGLIFSFHAREETAAEQETLSQFSQPAVNPDMLAVYPTGIHEEWQGDPAAKSNDVAFTLQMIDVLSQQFCIESSTIYAAGKSNGGGFAAAVLACDPVASVKIAAFAGVSGAYYTNTSAKACNASTCAIACTPGRAPVPILTTHGTADKTIPYGGGGRRGECLPSIPHFMTAWAVRNGLGSANVTTVQYGGKVDQFEFGGGDSLGVNTAYEIFGLGHMWPSTTRNPDGCCAPFNASTVIMNFFQSWPLPPSTGSTNGTTSASSKTFIG